MASIIKYPKGWRVLIDRRGIRKSKTFTTKQEARDWANAEEAAILGGARASAKLPLGDILDRYAREVSPGKEGHRWEAIRLEKLQRDPVAKIRLSDLVAEDFARWRDQRLREVSPGSVRREMNLLSAVLSVAVREWGLIAESPMRGVRMPKPPQRRERRVHADEIERMAYVAGDDLSAATARAFHAFLFSIETGMRAGEVLSLSPETVDVERRVAELPKTKNGTARQVPLSSEAVRLWQALPGEGVDLTSAQLDALFRKVRDKAKVVGLTYHDSRHEAITRLARVLQPLDLARMVGHRDLKMLLTYYDESAEDIAKRLD